MEVSIGVHIRYPPSRGLGDLQILKDLNQPAQYGPQGRESTVPIPLESIFLADWKALLLSTIRPFRYFYCGVPSSVVPAILSRLSLCDSFLFLLVSAICSGVFFRNDSALFLLVSSFCSCVLSFLDFFCLSILACLCDSSSSRRCFLARIDAANLSSSVIVLCLFANFADFDLFCLLVCL